MRERGLGESDIGSKARAICDEAGLRIRQGRQPTRLSMDAVRFRTFLFTLPRHFHRRRRHDRAASSPFSPTPHRRRRHDRVASRPTPRSPAHRQRIDSRRLDAPFLSRRSVHRFLAIFTAYARRRSDNASIPDAPTLRFYPVASSIDCSPTDPPPADFTADAPPPPPRTYPTETVVA